MLLRAFGRLNCGRCRHAIPVKKNADRTRTRAQAPRTKPAPLFSAANPSIHGEACCPEDGGVIPEAHGFDAQPPSQ